MTKQNNKVSFFINHKTLPGKRDEVKQIWEQYMQPEIAQNKAHEAYFYCFDNNDPDTLCVYQQYSDYESSQAFLETTNYARYHKEVSSLLAGEPEILVATPMWIKNT